MPDKKRVHTKLMYDKKNITNIYIKYDQPSWSIRINFIVGSPLQHIAGAVRRELGVEEPYWNRSITKPYRSELGMFLEAKSFTGARADRLKYETEQET